ncbi:MAG: thioesterase family protein [Bacillota bacterium]
MKQVETFLRVRYKDTDQMGLVYYANYFVWFEVGRAEFLRSLGMSYKSLEQSEIFLPVIEAYCEYKYPARYDDELRVVTTLKMLQEVRLGFHYDIFKVDKVDNEDILLVSGETMHAFVNKKGRPLVLRKQNPFLWRMLKEFSLETVD